MWLGNGLRFHNKLHILENCHPSPLKQEKHFPKGNNYLQGNAFND